MELPPCRSRGKKSSRERRDRSSLSDSRKTGKRKRPSAGFSVGELPAPPPEPGGDGFPGTQSGVSIPEEASKVSRGARAVGVEDAFDHLDKLHSMVEEILEMRDRNAKLFKRVRELERTKARRRAHCEVERSVSQGQEVVLPDEDVGFAESLLGAMLASSYEVRPLARTGPVRSSPSTREAGSRSQTADNRRVSCPVSPEAPGRREAAKQQSQRPRLARGKEGRPCLGAGTPKVSKWTRVKAAFKWEKAACTTNEPTYESTNAPTNQPTNEPTNDPTNEPTASARYLRIPENVGGSSEVSGPPTPAGTISSSSSIDDVFHRPRRPSSHHSTRITRRDESSDPSRRSRSLDGDASVPMTFVYSPRTRSKDSGSLQGRVDPRSHKTPWGKVKDMMQLRRDSLGKQPGRSGSRNEDAHSTSSIESSELHRSEPQHIDGRPPRVRITSDSSSGLATSPSKPGANTASDFVDLASRRLTPTLTITVPSSEELRSISSPESITPPPPRQSFESGKSESRYSQAGYETPKETRTGQVSPASSSSGILRYGLGRSKTCQGVPFADFRRQQSLKGESLGSSPKMQRRDSKWNKVKRAFLTSATSVPTSPSRISSYFFDDGDATGGSYSASASAEDLDNDAASNSGAQAEIQRNYRLLHDKLGSEFYRKLAEWEKLKGSGSRDSPKSSARDRDAENMRLLGEERLTPEFKKKLEEWKKMNKGETRGEHRSVNRRRITDWQLWRSPSSKSENKPDSPRLSEDFLKKMEEWKRIKSAGSHREAEEEQVHRETRAEPEEEEEEEEEEDVRRAGAKLCEERRKAWKSLEDEEFRSLERVLEVMEMDRQTRLSKLQRMVGAPPQRNQEVLIHTSTGLYRFEGISRNFTRKLYEWEKSQGISPELSTFRLLDPLRYGVGSLRSRETPVHPTGDGARRRTLYRSKSVGSVQTNAWRTTREHEKPIRRPSSLSLNEVDNLEARSCIIGSSVRTIPDEEDTSEDIALEDSEPEQEPEAVIVDIEDVIEETASPLRKYQPHQTPVYSVAGSETTSIAIPLGTVTARHEPSPVILIEPGEAHPLSGHSNILEIASYALEPAPPPEITSIMFPSSPSDTRQPARSIEGGRREKREAPHRHEDKLPRVERGRSGRAAVAAAVAAAANTDRREGPPCETESPRRASHDANKRWQMVQPTHDWAQRETLERRLTEEEEPFEESVITVRSNVRHSKKLLKTRRLTDTQVGYDWRSTLASSNDSENCPVEPEDAIETAILPNAGDFQDNPNVERIMINEETMNRVVVPTASSSTVLATSSDLNQDDESFSRKERREPRSVFVKTKRMVFSPFRREPKKIPSDPIDSPTSSEKSEKSGKSEKSTSSPSLEQEAEKTTSAPNFPPQDSKRALESSENCPQEPPSAKSTVNDSSASRGSSPRLPVRPPLPKSPILSRKEYRVNSPKETSPSIRMMIKRYNEKLESEASGFGPLGASSPANSSGSGSSSPSWRTPVTERRLSTRTERFDLSKKPPMAEKNCCNSCTASCEGISKMAAASNRDFSRQTSNFEIGNRSGELASGYFARGRRSPSSQSDGPKGIFDTSGYDCGSTLSVRALRIKKAKEDFLSRGPSIEDSSQERGSIEENGEHIDFREERKDEERSVAARVDLVKSASAGMINVDADTFERLQLVAEAAAATRMSDSLPRSNEHLRHPAATKESTSRFAQIARKFKRARLRSAKEKESRMSTVSMLCRQSLLVDIGVEGEAEAEAGSSEKSCPQTPRGREREEASDEE